jgi:hypothetical protein
MVTAGQGYSQPGQREWFAEHDTAERRLLIQCVSATFDALGLEAVGQGLEVGAGLGPQADVGPGVADVLGVDA